LIGEMLEISGLRKEFGVLKVIDGLDLSVPAGAVLGMIGPNGAGKTTLFNVIAGVTPPSAGSIRLEGREIVGMNAWRRCRLGIARTYQIPKPFSGMTVFENVLTAAVHGAGLRLREAAARVAETLDLVALGHRSAALAGELSLLDLKRLELAKALASGPRLLLLDEIAGGLTDAECDALLDIIAVVQQRGTTIVWIEHVIHALRRVAGTIVVLFDGGILASGTPDAVLADRRVKEVYLGTAE
jgi:branched-chain amino acid transport system ATP-binding protein